jgi:hypothetical protein
MIHKANMLSNDATEKSHSKNTDTSPGENISTQEANVPESFVDATQKSHAKNTDTSPGENISTQEANAPESCEHITTPGSSERKQKREQRAGVVPHSASHATSADAIVSNIGMPPIPEQEPVSHNLSDADHTREVGADVEHCMDYYVFMFSAHSYDCVTVCS